MSSIQICLDVHFTAVFRNVFLHHLVYTLFLLIRLTLLYSSSMSERIDTNPVICLRRPLEWSFKTTEKNRNNYGFLYFSLCSFTLKAGRQKYKGKLFLILSTVPWRRTGRWRYGCTVPFKSNRQSVSPNCIQLDLKYIHLFNFHDMFRLQRVIIKWISNINIIEFSHSS
jgi:hypothetical protein